MAQVGYMYVSNRVEYKMTAGVGRFSGWRASSGWCNYLDHTRHSTQYTVYSTPDTVHSTPDTAHSTLDKVHIIVTYGRGSNLIFAEGLLV